MVDRREGERMNPQPAHGENTSAALSLVNTKVTGTSGVLDRLAEEHALSEWLHSHAALSGLTPSLRRPGRARLAKFQQLRDDARALLTALINGEALPQAGIDRVNQTAAEPVRPVLTGDGTILWKPIRPGATEAQIARDLMRLLTSIDGTRLRICAAEDCDRMFLQDHGRTIWCSTACGNRMRARRHATRRRAQPARPGIPR
jgi:predicted RNA-binding Zn ribbon-like protein